MSDGTMTGIDYFAWFVLIVIVVSLVAVFVALARLPGQIAHKRGYPQAEGINAAGWLGLLLTLGVVWALAVIWAMLKPGNKIRGSGESTERVAAITSHLAELETRIDATQH